MVQRVKDLALSQQQLGLLLWHGFDSPAREIPHAWAWPKIKKIVGLFQQPIATMHIEYLAWSLVLSILAMKSNM